MSKLFNDSILHGHNFLLQSVGLRPVHPLALLHGLIPPDHDGLVSTENRNFSGRVTQPLLSLTPLDGVQRVLVLGDLHLGTDQVVFECSATRCLTSNLTF